ncbi:MAG: hypothetical protein KAJ51_17965 [Thermoplasmata archaeon]|nr:hypothetical protein [Thermoplasmata archaeon]
MDKRELRKWLAYGMILVLVVVLPATAFAGDQPSGKPFEAIWNELANHQQQLDDETAARIAADDALQAAIDAEEAARIAADDALQDEIDLLEQRIDNEGMPIGSIILWSGTIDGNGNPIIGGSSDTNWHICDGTQGTPDLRNRFVVGSGGSYATGNTGGANGVTLTENQIPGHTHTFSGSTSSDGAHNHRYYDKWPSVDSAEHNGKHVGSEDCWDTQRTTSSAGDHSHSFSGTTASTGGDGSHENRPPYYALAFIMKIQ